MRQSSLQGLPTCSTAEPCGECIWCSHQLSDSTQEGPFCRLQRRCGSRPAVRGLSGRSGTRRTQPRCPRHVLHRQLREWQPRTAGGVIWPPAQHRLCGVVAGRRQQDSHIWPAQGGSRLILLCTIACKAWGQSCKGRLLDYGAAQGKRNIMGAAQKAWGCQYNPPFNCSACITCGNTPVASTCWLLIQRALPHMGGC